MRTRGSRRHRRDACDRPRDRQALRGRRARGGTDRQGARATSRAVSLRRRRPPPGPEGPFTAGRSTLPSRHSIAAGAGRHRAGGSARAGGHRPGRQLDRRLRHRPGDPARHDEARRLHDGGHRPARSAVGRRVTRAVRRHGQGAAVSRVDDDVSTVNGGVTGLTRSLVEELRPIRVNAIHPGVVGDSPVLGATQAAAGANYTSQYTDRATRVHGRGHRRHGVPAREPRRERGRPDRGRRPPLPLTVRRRPPRGTASPRPPATPT